MQCFESIFLLLRCIYLFSLAEIDDKEIDYHSGRMPRMIYFWRLASRGNLQAPFSNVLERFNTLAMSYYRQRIARTLDRAIQSSTSRSDRKRVFKVVAHVCLNTPVWNLPALWNISGPFIEVDDDDSYQTISHYACACPSVSHAFMKTLLDQTDQILHLLVGDLVSFIGALGRLRC